MKLQIGSQAFTALDIVPGSLSRASTSIPGLTELSLSLKLPFATVLPRQIKLCGLVASETTATPVKLFSGFYLGYTNAKHSQDWRYITYSLKIASALLFLPKSKAISNYAENKTALQHAIALAAKADVSVNISDLRYLQISDLASSSTSFPYAIDASTKNYQDALTDIANYAGLEIVGLDPGWTDIPTLLASANPIYALAFREPDTTQNPAAFGDITIDPSDALFCENYPFYDDSFAFEDGVYTSCQVNGRGAEKAVDDGDTAQTNFVRYVAHAIPTPVTDTTITSNPDVPFIGYPINLNPDIYKLNQVIIDTVGLITIVQPYDPTTPLSAGQAYFNRTANPPQIILSQDDVSALTAPIPPAVTYETYVFIRDYIHNTSAVTRLTSATNGAITHAYSQVNDQSIGDFTTAAARGTAEVNKSKDGFYKYQAKWRTTFDDVKNGESFRWQIPAQSIDKNMVIDSSTLTYEGEILVAGVARDQLVHSFSASNVSKSIFSGNSLLGGLSRAGLGGGTGNTSSNPPSPPTYEEIPFGESCSYNVITTFAGTGVSGSSGDTGLAVAAKLNSPSQIVKMGDFYIADSLNGKIRKVNNSGIITTFAGGGSSYNFDATGDGQLATDCQSTGDGIQGITTYGTDIYFVDTGKSTVGKISNDGIYHLIYQFSVADAPSGFALLGIIVNPTNGDIYVSDHFNHVIWKFTGGTGTPTVFAGILGSGGYTGEGTATAVQFFTPLGLCQDSAGNIYVADRGNHLVRKIDTSGNTSLIAGVAGVAGYNGDGIPANTAQLYSPSGVGIDNTGNVYILDSGNYRLRKVDTSGQITTIAGNGTAGYSGDGGVPTSAEINSEYYYAAQFYIDNNHNLYIPDQGNMAVRKIACVGSDVGTCPDLTALYALTSATTNGSHADRFVLGDQVLITPHALFTDADERSLNLTTQAIYTIDLTSPTLVGHVVTLASSIYLEIAANANKTYSGTMKINGTTILSINETLGTGSFTDNFTVSINTDLSAFIGSTITVQFDTELTSDVIESIPPGGVSLANTLMTSLGQCTLNC